MPTCPGCSRTVTYGELEGHVTHCKWLWSDDPDAETRWAQQIAERVHRLDEERATGSRLAPLGDRMKGLRDE